MSCWFILPAAIDGLLIAVLAVFVQVLSPNKYVGWGILFVWFVAGIFLSNMGYANPLYNYGGAPERAAQRFHRRRQLLDRRSGHSVLLAVLRVILPSSRTCCGRAGPTSRLAAALSRMPRGARRRRSAIVGVAAAAWPRTGAYAYYNIKVLNRYQTSDEAEKFSADYERKYLKYETLPQPTIDASRRSTSQLYPQASACW